MKSEQLTISDPRLLAEFVSPDELKTFFELGLWAPLLPSLAGGPRAGVGIGWDPSRRFGLYASLGFGAALGRHLFVALDFGVNAQVRFE